MSPPQISMPAAEPRTHTAKLRGALATVGRVVHHRRVFAEPSRSESKTQADLNQERVWALLEHGTVTVKELHDQGIRFPAQAMYDLQAAGYAIDRLRVTDGSGQSTVAYRLSAQSQAVLGQGARAPKDPHLIAGAHPSAHIVLSADV
jgi:hypothetical protein